MTYVNDAREADIAAAQAALAPLVRSHEVTADELAGKPVLDPGRPMPKPERFTRDAGERVSEFQLPDESAEAFLKRVPEARGPQSMPDDEFQAF